MHQQKPRRERFTFPDGSTLDIVVFGPSATEDDAARWAAHDPDAARDAASGPAADGARLTAAPSVCSRCGSEFLYPVEWERNRDGDWNILMRCPNCEAHVRIVLGREAVEELNRALYHHAQALARLADSISRRNFEEEAGKLVRALARDLILPMDF
jgi:hypothetical protein